jgi:hypothetical protein
MNPSTQAKTTTTTMSDAEKANAEAARKKLAAELTTKHGSTSGAIRALAAEGKSRGEIAKLLGKRYQHVRNVLITPVKNPKSVAAPQAAPATAAKK